jgi:hypothetical protein
MIEMVKEKEKEKEIRGDGDIRRKMKTQRSTMSPASLGGADRIQCAFDIQIMFRGFFFLVRCSITYLWRRVHQCSISIGGF